MTRNVLAVLAGAALMLQVTAGCAKNSKPDAAPRADGQVDKARRADRGIDRGPREQNQESAESILQQAESAEREGHYAVALNLYERLRSFPEASRPNDLDRRMAAVRQKMAAERGGAPGPTTLPVEPR